MPPIQNTPSIRIAPNNPVFDLPVIVAIQEGLFAKAGLDVSFSATYADREKDHAGKPAPIMARLKEQMFDCGSADSYNVCEWASIDRLERGTRSGNIAALRAAVAAHIEAHPELHAQSQWGDGSPDPACGTACCVAGWACHLGGGTHGMSVPTAATILLWQDGAPMPSFDSVATRDEILEALRS